MKYLILVLSIIVSLFSSGCVGGPTAGVSITNNVGNTTMVIESTRGEVLNPRIRTGEKAFAPVGNYPRGNDFVVSAKAYSPNGTYLGIAEFRDSVSFDSSYRYERTWIISHYNPITKRWDDKAVVSASTPVEAPAPKPVRPVGSIQIMNNLSGVKIVISSSEGKELEMTLMTGQTMPMRVGVSQGTRRFTLTAKVYSAKEEYLGYADYRDSIGEQEDFGNHKAWTISSFRPVRAQAKR